MNKNKIIYWTTTGIVAAIMGWSAVNFSFNEQMRVFLGFLTISYLYFHKREQVEKEVNA